MGGVGGSVVGGSGDWSGTVVSDGAMGLIKIAGDIQTATIQHDVQEFNLELPEKYPISPNSIHQIIEFTQQESFFARLRIQ